MTSPIADMLTRIRNAQAVKKSEVLIPASKMKAEICRILQENGFIAGFEIVDDTLVNNKKNIKVQLKYEDGRDPAIQVIKIISTPGRRIYSNSQKLPIVLNNFGIAIISTSQGLMTNKQARKKKLGGEIICEVY